MSTKPSERVNKSERCRRFGWTRYQFDQHAAAGMPVLAAAGHKGAEWRVDLAAVRRGGWHSVPPERPPARRDAEQRREAAWR